MDFQEFQNSIVEAVAEKVKKSKKKRELSPEEKERRRQVLANNVKKAKERKAKEGGKDNTPPPKVQEKLEPTRVEATLPSSPIQPVQQMPDFDNYFKVINDRFDKLESKFQIQNIQSLNTGPKKSTRNDVIKQPQRVIEQPVQPKKEVPKTEPEEVHVYTAFKPNPWS